jgi:hypothetical protein
MVNKMKPVLVLVALVLLAASLRSAGAGTVTVDFVDPARFTDVSITGRLGTHAEGWVLTEIRRYLESMGSRLGPRQTLQIEVLDIDLAGSFEWWHRLPFNEVRIERDVYPPRISLRYRLVEDGHVSREAQETLRDPNYLANPAAYFTPSDRLRYEKLLLSAWFESRFR